jgi:hypothetical protein
MTLDGYRFVTPSQHSQFGAAIEKRSQHQLELLSEAVAMP